jgi:hypothetical protein
MARGEGGRLRAINKLDAPRPDTQLDSSSYVGEKPSNMENRLTSRNRFLNPLLMYGAELPFWNDRVENAYNGEYSTISESMFEATGSGKSVAPLPSPTPAPAPVDAPAPKPKHAPVIQPVIQPIVVVTQPVGEYPYPLPSQTFAPPAPPTPSGEIQGAKIVVADCKISYVPALLGLIIGALAGYFYAKSQSKNVMAWAIGGGIVFGGIGYMISLHKCKPIGILSKIGLKSDVVTAPTEEKKFCGCGA